MFPIFTVTGSEEDLPELKLIDEAHLSTFTFPKVLNRSVLFPHWRKQNALMCSPLMQAVCSHSGFRVLLRLNVPIKIFSVMSGRSHRLPGITRTLQWRSDIKLKTD